MKKPSGIVYGVEESPPAGITVLSGLQHVGLISVILVFPLPVRHRRVEASHRGGRSIVLFHFDH